MANTKRSAVITKAEPERAGRFVLHRAGIRNVWQYDDAIFDFADGRLLLRGKNGAGKSKALEMLLPFLLDGDTRRLDAVGTAHRTTFAWLMTEGRVAGNHVGYVWLELHCAEQERFVTVGCGIKASTSTQRTDTWFFVTAKRVGFDLALATGNTPWTADRLRTEIGADDVMDSSAYRQRVRTVLFGNTDDGRYGHLLHLLHRLREPNIGDRIERSELPDLLSEALPPVDPDVLDDVAANFDDLEDIREQLKRTKQTAGALAEFLGSYQGYTRTQLRSRASAVSESHEALLSARKDENTATKSVAAAQDQVTAAEEKVASIGAMRDAADSEIRAITESEGYKTLNQLEDRRLVVAAAKSAAEASIAVAESARKAREDAALRSADIAVELERASGASRVTHSGLVRALVIAGIDAPHAGQPAAVTVDELPPASSETVAVLDGLVEVTRQGLPVVRADDDLEGAPARLDHVSHVVRARRLAIEGVLRLGQTAQKLAGEATEARRKAEELERALTEAVAALKEAEDEATKQGQSWFAELKRWTTVALAAAPSTDWALLVDASDNAVDVDEARRLLHASASAMNKEISDARAAEASARVALDDRESDWKKLREEKATLESTALISPTLPRARSALATDGAPLFEVIDFKKDVNDQARAGIEAGLEASGLLSAWVTAEAVHLLDRDDVWAVSGETYPGTSLGDACEASTEGAPISAEIVSALLGSIAFVSEGEELPDWPTAFCSDGRWRLGGTLGKWRKQSAQFVGAGARAAHRARLLGDLDVRIAEAERARQAAAAERARFHETLTTRERLLTTLPAVDPLLTAAAFVRSAADAVAKARRAHGDADRRATDKKAIAVRATAEFVAAAVAESLPDNVALLEERLNRLRAIPALLASTIREASQLVSDYARWMAAAKRWNAADAGTKEPEIAARHRIADYREQKLEHEKLAASIGSDPADLLRDLRAAKDRREQAKRDLPAAQKTALAAVKSQSDAEGILRGAESAVAVRVEELKANVARLRAALELQGVARAAFGSESETVGRELTEVGDEPHQFAAAVSRRAPGPVVTDSTILRRYDELHNNLAGGFDVSSDEREGIKIFTLHDANGAQPVAVVAERLSEESAAASGRLTQREQEVFERFLLGSLGDALRHHLHDAAELTRSMNEVLARMRTSHGLGVELLWNLRDEASAPTATAAKLLQVAGKIRPTEQNDELRRALQALIESERQADPSAGYRKLLDVAVDYRRWHQFTVRIVDDANPNRRQTLGPRAKVSQGEQRVLAYLTLFSAAAAHFNSVERMAPQSPRLILLDDAFAKVDEPTHGRLLELLVQLRLDFIITSERLWGMFPGVPSLAIYECLRDPHVPGVAIVAFRWNGVSGRLAKA